MEFSSIFRSAEVVKNLVIINGLIFLVKMFAPAAGIHEGLVDYYLGLHYAGEAGFYPWQIVTHMFMHVNFTHLLFNMLGLVSLGTILERFWGPKRFLFFYLAAGLGGAFFHEISQAVLVYSKLGSLSVPDQWVGHVAGIAMGASGAIYGVFAAFAMLFPNTEMYVFLIPIPIKAKYLVIIFIALDLFMGFGGSSLIGLNIANFAHLGGAAVGAILVLIWRKNRNQFY